MFWTIVEERNYLQIKFYFLQIYFPLEQPLQFIVRSEFSFTIVTFYDKIRVCFTSEIFAQITFHRRKIIFWTKSTFSSFFWKFSFEWIFFGRFLWRCVIWNYRGMLNILGQKTLYHFWCNLSDISHSDGFSSMIMQALSKIFVVDVFSFAEHKNYTIFEHLLHQYLSTENIRTVATFEFFEILNSTHTTDQQCRRRLCVRCRNEWLQAS